MRLLLVLILFAFLAAGTAPAATLSVCASGCTYVNAQIQTALNAAACGDTVQLQAGATYTGNFTVTGRSCSASTPITVISSRAAWLPLEGTRITPSHQGNMARLRTLNTVPALAGVLSASGEPANYWQFVGIEFDTTVTGPIVFQLVSLHFGYIATGPADLPTGVVFDRCYFHGNHANTTSIQSALRLETRAATVKNSFFDELVAPGFENHGVDGFTVEGPWTIENNFFAVGSIPVFSGGAEPEYLGAGLGNATLRFNYLSKRYKWWGPAAAVDGSVYNPFYADYTANGGVTPCMKNGLEFKSIAGALVQYNVVDLSPGSCQSQFFGFTLTPRTTHYDSNNYVPGMGTAAISAGTAVLTYTGTASLPLMVKPGHGVCAVTGSSPSAIGHCRVIASIDTNTKEITVTSNFTASGSGLRWFIVSDPNVQWSDVKIADNVLREVVTCFQILGLDPSPGNAAGDARITNLEITNNLCVNKHMPGGSWLRLTAADVMNIEGVSAYVDGFKFEHNGNIEDVATSRWALIVGDDVTGGNYFHAASIRNNYSPSGDFGFNLSGSGGGFGAAAVDNAFDTDAVVSHNAMPPPDMVGQSWNCSGGRDCSGTLTGTFNPKWAAADKGIYTLLPSSPYAKAGTDRTNLGPNFDRLPLIKNLKSTPSQNGAQLEFDLSAPIASVPCVVEVSASRNLQSGLGDYTVVNALNPVFFKQPDVSNRSNPKLAPILRDGMHIQWPIGQAGAVMGDDGVSHDLSLPAGTRYYGRLQCGGDTQLFAFQTQAAAAVASTFAIKAQVPAGTTSLVAEYGPTPSLGATASALPDGGLNAVVNIPFTSGTRLYYRLKHQAGAATTYVGPLQIAVF